MTPKFTCDPKKERIYVTDEWISNSHWAFHKEWAAKLYKAGFRQLKPLMPLLVWKNGHYENGEYASDKSPDMNRAIPNLLGYEVLLPPKTARVNEMGDVYAIVYEFLNGGVIGIAPKYTPLLRIGYPKAKSQNDPVAIIVDEELVGVVMPVRIH